MLITIARKPLEGTVINNALLHGCGALNIDASRIILAEDGGPPRLGGKGLWHIAREASTHTVSLPGITMGSSPLGRWPANTILISNPKLLSEFPESFSGTEKFGIAKGCKSIFFGMPLSPSIASFGTSGLGSAARFFKQIKADKQT